MTIDQYNFVHLTIWATKKKLFSLFIVLSFAGRVTLPHLSEQRVDPVDGQVEV